MARYIMIIVLGGIFTFGISNISQNSTVNQGTQNVVDNFSNNRAHDIAGSMTDILLMRLANNLDYRVETEVSEDLDGGEATYIVEDTFFEGDSLVKVKVAAEYNDITKTIITYTQKPTDGWVPPVIRGAWTANGNLNNTISDMFIDGRDHDLSLNLIPETGVYGVSTSTDFINVEDAAIGGTNNKIDYPMTFPEIPEVIEENYNWDGGFPESPDAILGYPEGTLKAAAKSGEYGSQYRLNPPKDGKHIDGLTYPLSGVTYIEITNGIEYELRLEQNGNSGIIVVHNSDRTSKIIGVKFDEDNSDGLLTGLLVTDYSFHHHIDILGSVLMLSPNLETSKNCKGNKDHWVYYSSEAIISATEIVANITGLSGQVGYGFGKKRVNVKYVYE
jgi:hypothetical protein